MYPRLSRPGDFADKVRLSNCARKQHEVKSMNVTVPVIESATSLFGIRLY